MTYQKKESLSWCLVVQNSLKVALKRCDFDIKNVAFFYQNLNIRRKHKEESLGCDQTWVSVWHGRLLAIGAEDKITGHPDLTRPGCKWKHMFCMFYIVGKLWIVDLCNQVPENSTSRQNFRDSPGNILWYPLKDCFILCLCLCIYIYQAKPPDSPAWYAWLWIGASLPLENKTFWSNLGKGLFIYYVIL